MINKPHKIVYEVLIVILLILCVLLGNKLDNMQKKAKYYKPLDSRLTIKKSNINGLGLFTTEEIPVGETLGVSHVYDERFQNKYIRTPLGGFINHSDTPNLKAYIDKDFRYVKTLRHIKEGEELTLQYDLYNVK